MVSATATGSTPTTATTSGSADTAAEKSWEDLERQIFEDDDVDDDDDYDDARPQGKGNEKEEEEEEVVEVNQECDMVEEEDEARYVPPPRQSGSSSKVVIGFTPRLFPTPMRESKRADEEDWIARNRPYLKTNKVRGNRKRRQIMEIIRPALTFFKEKGGNRSVRREGVRFFLQRFGGFLSYDIFFVGRLWWGRSPQMLRISVKWIPYGSKGKVRSMQ